MKSARSMNLTTARRVVCELRRLLVKLEWRSEYDSEFFCPWCFWSQESGHAYDCQLALAIGVKRALKDKRLK